MKVKEKGGKKTQLQRRDGCETIRNNDKNIGLNQNISGLIL